MVEVEVGDDDRVDLRPVLVEPQTREHARPAVDEQPASSALDQVARMCAARVGPRG